MEHPWIHGYMHTHISPFIIRLEIHSRVSSVRTTCKSASVRWCGSLMWRSYSVQWYWHRAIRYKVVCASKFLYRLDIVHIVYKCCIFIHIIFTSLISGSQNNPLGRVWSAQNVDPDPRLGPFVISQPPPKVEWSGKMRIPLQIWCHYPTVISKQKKKRVGEQTTNL